MPERRLGTYYGVAAYLLWGLLPLYWPLLRPAGPVEILAHRIIWSLVFIGILLAARRRWSAVWVALRDRRTAGILAAASVLIAVNWGSYIYGVNSGLVVETSLGYFINPLLSMLLGVLLLHEQLRKAQWWAVGLAGMAVVVLTVDYGRPPWLALSLAGTFGVYGLLKKIVPVAPAEGLAIESGLLALPAAGVLLVMQSTGSAQFGHVSTAHTVLTISSGIVTAVPLLLFAAAARRVPLTTIGRLQYLAPIMQLALGLTVFHESMPPGRLAGFALVWAALVIFMVDSARHGSRRRRTGAPVP